MKLNIITFFVISFSTYLIASNGKILFEQNCFSCHLFNKKSVGPSIREIRSIYSKDDFDKMVAWIKNPKYKRKDGIQMPPMEYLGDLKIKTIIDYIQNLPNGYFKKWKEKNEILHQLVPLVNRKQFKQPIVRRLFIPGVGPSSFYVHLLENYYLCFDPGLGEIRHLYQGKMDAKEPYITFYKSPSSRYLLINKKKQRSFFLKQNKDEIIFLGYEIDKDSRVKIKYQLGKAKISLSPTLKGENLILSYEIENVNKIMIKPIFDKTVFNNYFNQVVSKKKEDFLLLFKGKGNIKFDSVIKIVSDI